MNHDIMNHRQCQCNAKYGYNTLSVSDEELILGSNISVKLIMKARHHRFISE